MPETRLVKAGPEPDGGLPLAEMAASLLEGAVAAYPTETFYALGAAAFSKKGVERVYRLKGRDRSKPLPLIASDLEMVARISGPQSPLFARLAEEFWPGPLTLVLPAAPGLPEAVLGPGRTVAVRVPPPAWLRALVRQLAEPLTSTSANLAGESALDDPAEVAALVRDKVDWLIDGGRTPGGRPSTIVDLTGEAPRILREGAVPSVRMIEFLT